MKPFLKYTHCGQTYYTGINAPSTPICSECGEKIKTLDAVEIYREDDNLTEDTKPVETFPDKQTFLESQ